MPRSYSYEVRAEAIARCYQGKDWLNIQALIQEKYGVRPGIRQMQKWVEIYKGSTGDPPGVRYITKQIEEAVNLAKLIAQCKLMAEIRPLWSEMQDKYLMVSSDAGWIASLAFFESQVGRQDFDRLVNTYRTLRDKGIQVEQSNVV